MAFSTFKKFFFCVLGLSVLFFVYAPQQINGHPLKLCKFDQIYTIGDSVSDTTGDSIKEIPVEAVIPFGILPYGESFHKNSTNRCSSGVLIHDYIAKAAGLPLPPRYKNIDADFKHGANFAEMGSTALPSEILMAKHNISSATTSSLGMQLDSMSNHFDSVCVNDRDCLEKLQSALFMVEEIGGNDYKYAIFQGKTVEELKSMVPEVVSVIIGAVKKVIDLGATRVIVPGNYPMGCLPIYQTVFKSNDVEAYDENKCLKELNDFSKYHNEQLQQAIDKLNQEKPNAVIVYGDSYKAYQFVFRFSKYTYGYPVFCADSHNYMSWDVVHLNPKGYWLMADVFLHDIFGKLQCQYTF